MQISGVSNSQLIPMERSSASQPAPSTLSSDAAEFNVSPDTFSSFVQQAGSQPEVRSELVDSYKARINSGHYPAQDVIAGLTKLLGGGVMAAAKAAGNVTLPEPTSSETSSNSSSD